MNINNQNVLFGALFYGKIRFKPNAQRVPKVLLNGVVLQLRQQHKKSTVTGVQIPLGPQQRAALKTNARWLSATQEDTKILRRLVREKDPSLPTSIFHHAPLETLQACITEMKRLSLEA